MYVTNNSCRALVKIKKLVNLDEDILKFINKKYTVLGVCYKSQIASELEIEKMLKAIRIASKEQAVLMGDFNYPGIN